MKYFILIIFFLVLGCDESSRKDSDSDSDDVAECDWSCDFIDISYDCHKEMLGYEIIPDYKEEYKFQGNDCKDWALEIVNMIQDDFYSMRDVCTVWRSNINKICDFQY